MPALLSAGVFYKNLDNPIVPLDFCRVARRSKASMSSPAFINGSRTPSCFGFELAVQQQLTFLPAPLDGFLGGGQLHLCRSEAEASDPRRRRPRGTAAVPVAGHNSKCVDRRMTRTGFQAPHRRVLAPVDRILWTRSADPAGTPLPRCLHRRTTCAGLDFFTASYRVLPIRCASSGNLFEPETSSALQLSGSAQMLMSSS